jgi:hypothetical protein
MGLKEMMKDVQQNQNMSLILAIELRLANIIDNHVTNFFAAVFERQEVLSECRCGDFRQVFVLRDSKHLFYWNEQKNDPKPWGIAQKQTGADALTLGGGLAVNVQRDSGRSTIRHGYRFDRCDFLQQNYFPE